ncbi:MAG: DDE-type integrase/transposase/recombinase [Myxococcota bacterium]
MSEPIRPKSHAEAVALFRAGVIGPLTTRELVYGQLADELRKLSKTPFRPFWLDRSYCYAVSTLERWYYAYRSEGLVGLEPRPRSDKGYAQALTNEQRILILEIAKERPEVSATVLVRTLEADGRLGAREVSPQTVRRLLAAHGLDRKTRRQMVRGRTRRRWQADAPDALWHADVCHGPSLRIGGRTVPLRIHALLDDASRFIIGIRAFSTEREVDMLALLVQALRESGPPRTLYVDNGSTYRGEALHLAGERLGIRVVHADPYDPQARGKMERFWRTLREGCLDHIGTCNSLHDVQVRLLAFIGRHYHAAPHSGLVGRCPADVYATERPSQNLLAEEDLREALVVRTTRRIKNDGTVPVGGIDWEVEEGYLAGRKVTVARTLFDPKAPPWIEEGENRRHILTPVDPIANATRPRKRTHKNLRGVDAIPFDPAGALVDRATGRRAHPERGER